MICIWWHWTRKLPVLWRNVLRVLPVALALTPWSVSADHERLAPALLVAIFEGLFRDGGSAWRAGTSLLLSILFSLALVTFIWWRGKRNEAARSDSSGENAAQ